MRLLFLSLLLMGCVDEYAARESCEASSEGIVRPRPSCMQQCNRVESADGVYYKWMCWRW